MPVSRLAVSGMVRPAGWRPHSPRQIQVDTRGWWRWQARDGRWYVVLPESIHTGPGARWITVSGATLDSHGLSARRARCTIWASSVSPSVWRSLCVAVQWRMQQGARA